MMQPSSHPTFAKHCQKKTSCVNEIRPATWQNYIKIKTDNDKKNKT